MVRFYCLWSSRPRWSMHTSWTSPQSDNQALLFLDNSGLSWTVSAPDKVSVVPVRWNGNFQTSISVPAVRPKRCHTLSNPAHRQDYTVACLNYSLQTMMQLPGWPAPAAVAPNEYDNNNIACDDCCRLAWCYNGLDCAESGVSASAADNVITDVNGRPTLVITRADKRNQGVYVLQASNSFGRVMSPGITLRLAGYHRSNVIHWFIIIWYYCKKNLTVYNAF